MGKILIFVGHLLHPKLYINPENLENKKLPDKKKFYNMLKLKDSICNIILKDSIYNIIFNKPSGESIRAYPI